MSDRPPFARLPQDITLTLEEVAVVLFALDAAEMTAAPVEDEAIRQAIALVTSKLWPELGDLLGEPEE